MVAQVDEQNAAMIAAVVEPAGKPDGLADMPGSDVVTGMGAVQVHEKKVQLLRTGGLESPFPAHGEPVQL